MEIGMKMIYTFEDWEPSIDADAFIAPGACVAGRVTVGPGVSIWFNTVVRGDADQVTIGPFTNIQDGCVLHEDQGKPLIIGQEVTVGHRVVLHGCVVGDRAFIGMGAVILSGARIGAGAVIGAGALVLENQHVPPGMLALGSPAKVVRGLTDEEMEYFGRFSAVYHERSIKYKRALGAHQ